MNGYGHTAIAGHKISINRRRKARPQISRKDLRSAIKEYAKAGGKITRIDDQGMSEVFAQDEDYRPSHWSTSKDEISGIANNE